MLKRLAGLGLGVVLLCANALAEQAPATVDTAGLVKQLHGMIPGLEAKDLRPAPIPGFFEIVIGTQLVYVSADGRYLFNGTLMDLRSHTDLTEQRRNGLRRELLAGLDEKEMLIYAPEKTLYTLTVFTDIDCGYCRKLHKEMDQLLAQGIRVRYLFYPRAGVGSNSYKKAVSVWCSDDPLKALTEAKLGKDPVEKTCPNPVDKQLALGEAFGVSGTPTLIMESGRVLPGYVPAARLALMLAQDKARIAE